MNKKILICDPIHNAGIELLRNRGLNIVQLGPGEKSKLQKKIVDVHVVIVRSKTRIDEKLLSISKNLELVIRAGVGTDNIDLSALKKRKIKLITTPTATTHSVADHTFALLLAVTRKVLLADKQLRTGNWGRENLKGIELQGKTIGIIGLGRIGREVAIRSHGFGLKVIVYDPFIKEESATEVGATLVSLDKLIKESDIITIHVPLSNKTKNLIGKTEIGKMKKGVYIINTARGPILDEDCLYEALLTHKVAGAGLDVFTVEKGISKFFNLDNVVVTPHIGASTYEAQEKISIQVAKEILKFYGM
jgi:D-3-phosphoglycerate dehydrogenase